MHLSVMDETKFSVRVKAYWFLHKGFSSTDMSSCIYWYVVMHILICPHAYTDMSSCIYWYVVMHILICPHAYTDMSSCIYWYVVMHILICPHAYISTIPQESICEKLGSFSKLPVVRQFENPADW